MKKAPVRGAMKAPARTRPPIIKRPAMPKARSMPRPPPRAMNWPMSRAGFLKGMVAATFAGAAAMAAPWGMAQPANEVVLDPSGDYVNVTLVGMIHIGPGSGTSTDLSTENPIIYGFPVLDQETHYTDNGEDWVARTYITQDMYNIKTALANGGTIILNPGTYNWNARVTHSKIINGQEIWQYTGMSFEDWNSAVDYHIKGAARDANSPTTKIICDQFIHAGADDTWIATPTQLIENIHFDNKEYVEWRIQNGAWSPSLFGWFGQADLAMKKCRFTGGGITYHNFGKVAFEDNVMEETIYGIELTYPADSDFLVSGNRIRTISGVGIYNEGTYFSSPAGDKVSEIVRNEVEWAGFAGIATYFTSNSTIIRLNKVTAVPWTYANPSGQYAGIGAWVILASSLINNNQINGGNDCPFTGINLSGTSESTVQSNQVIGLWGVPIFLDNSEGSSNYNVLVANNLNNANHLFGAHIAIEESNYNVVRGGAAAGSNIDVLNYGTGNLVAGLNEHIGRLQLEEPYTSMKEAMRQKFADANSVGWNQEFEWEDGFRD